VAAQISPHLPVGLDQIVVGQVDDHPVHRIVDVAAETHRLAHMFGQIFGYINIIPL
jgi:hypothetical protein